MCEVKHDEIERLVKLRGAFRRKLDETSRLTPTSSFRATGEFESRARLQGQEEALRQALGEVEMRIVEALVTPELRESLSRETAPA